MGVVVAGISDFAGPALGFAVACLAVAYASSKLPSLQKLPFEGRLYCALCCGSFLNCSIVTWPAIAALYSYWSAGSLSQVACVGDGATNIVHLQASPSAILACALTCGFFLQDSLVMLIWPKETAKGLGGPVAYKIMWMHHLVSLVVWPYALANSVDAVFVIQNISTELTNIGQNIFLLASKSDMFGKDLALPIGIVWMVMFFVVRIVPMPFVLYGWFVTHVLSPGCGMLTAEWVLGMITVPIPQMLNAFWFYKIVNGALKKMRKKK